MINYPIRINKYIANMGYSTRRGADKLISSKLVKINGKIAKLGDVVGKDDKITIEKDKIKKDFVYFAYNKPKGISTNKEIGVKDILSTTKFPKKVFPIGRLDKDSYGLIIMTDDGRITDKLLSPVHVHEKEYIVKVEPNFTDKFVKLMSNGVRFDRYVSKKCIVERYKNSQNTFKIVLTEGKKRQIRRMSEALHHTVIDLKRIRVMNIQLGDLKQGEYREIKDKELDTFLESLHIKKAL